MVSVSARSLALLDRFASAAGGRSVLADLALHYAMNNGQARDPAFDRLPRNLSLHLTDDYPGKYPGDLGAMMAQALHDYAIRHRVPIRPPLTVRREPFFVKMPRPLRLIQARRAFRDGHDIPTDMAVRVESALATIANRLHPAPMDRVYAEVDPRLFEAVESLCVQTGMDIDTLVTMEVERWLA